MNTHKNKKHTYPRLTEVAAITVVNKEKILMGERRDLSGWTNPGGHVEKGESPRVAAKRELLEEAGVKLPLSSFKPRGHSIVDAGKGKKLKVHSFRVDTEGTPPKTDSSRDPDEEVHKWEWKKPTDKKMLGNLHVPKKNNVVFKDLKENGMLKKAYDEGEDLAFMKVAKVRPGSNFTLLEMLAQKKAANATKAVISKPRKARAPVTNEPNVLDYSKFNNVSQGRPAGPAPTIDWNLLR